MDDCFHPSLKETNGLQAWAPWLCPFPIDDVNYSPSNTKRCDAVCRFIDTLKGKENDSSMQVVYAFYQMHADCSAKVLDDPDYSADVKKAVVTLTHQLSGDDVNIVLEENKI